jgi:hypothetical protein
VADDDLALSDYSMSKGRLFQQIDEIYDGVHLDGIQHYLYQLARYLMVLL